MRVETLEREVENMAHTLVDLKTIATCCESTLSNIKPRISLLEDRIDKFATEIETEKQFIHKRQENGGQYG